MVMEEGGMKFEGPKSMPRSSYPVEQPMHAEHCRKGGR